MYFSEHNCIWDSVFKLYLSCWKCLYNQLRQRSDTWQIKEELLLKGSRNKLATQLGLVHNGLEKSMRAQYIHLETVHFIHPKHSILLRERALAQCKKFLHPLFSISLMNDISLREICNFHIHHKTLSVIPLLKGWKLFRANLKSKSYRWLFVGSSTVVSLVIQLKKGLSEVSCQLELGWLKYLWGNGLRGFMIFHVLQLLRLLEIPMVVSRERLSIESSNFLFENSSQCFSSGLSFLILHRSYCLYLYTLTLLYDCNIKIRLIT